MPNKSAKIKAKSARYSLWYRMYVEIIDDPKTALLSDRHGWGWVRLLASAKRIPGGVMPPIPEIAFYLRSSPKDVDSLVNDLIDFGLLDVVEMRGTTPIIRPHNWDGRQFQWDGRDVTQAERKRRSRSRKRHGHGQVTVEVTEVRSVSVVTEGNSSARDALWPSTSRDALAGDDQVSIQGRIEDLSGEVLP